MIVRTIKRCAVLLLALLISSAMFLPAYSADGVLTGVCGPLMRWSFDTESGELAIRGSGPMYNYAHYTSAYNTYPWLEYRNKITSVVIEEGVTTIGEYAFSNLSSLKNITLPSKSLTTIGKNAFSYDGSLSRFIVPDSVTSLGREALGACLKLRGVRFGKGTTTLPPYICTDCSELTTVEFSGECVSLGTGAFYRCEKLSSIDFSTFRDIGASSFYNCKALTSVTLGKNLTYLRTEAFSGCTALSEIKFEATPEHIDSGAFYNTAYYKSLSTGLHTLCNGEVLFSKGVAFFTDTSYKVPDGVKVIADSTFYNSQNLSSLTISESVESIGYGAFEKCPKLKSVTVPSGVKYLDKECFGYNVDNGYVSPVTGFTIKCGSCDSAAYKYAVENGFKTATEHIFEKKTELEDCTKGGISYDECAVCGEVTNVKFIPISEHETETLVTAESCTSPEIIRTTCKKCRMEITKTGKAPISHIPSEEWTILSLSGCTEYGKLAILCKECGEVLEEKLMVPKGHASLITQISKEAGCTENGIEQTVCRECGKIISEEVIPAAGHSFGDFSSIVIADENGKITTMKIRTCSVCGAADIGCEDFYKSSERQTMISVLADTFLGNTSVSDGDDVLDLNRNGKIEISDYLTAKKSTY